MKGTKYGLEKLQVGESKAFDVSRQRLADSAQGLKERHGLHFTIRKDGDRVAVTRIEAPLPRHDYQGMFSGAPVGWSVGFETLSLATSAWESAKRQCPHARWATKKTRDAFLVIRIA